MQAHSTLWAEPQAAAPVKVSPARGPWEDQKLFNQLVTSCAYQLYVSRNCHDGHAMDDWLEAETLVLNSEAHCPAGFIDLDDVLDVVASVGDFAAEDLEISVAPYRLTIAGDRGRTARARGRSRKLGSPHPVLKILRLPVEVNPSRAIAELRHGMLHIVLPKMFRTAESLAHTKAA